MVDILPWYAWSYAAAGVITLAVAALVWRRGGTAGVQAVAALVLVPYTAFYLLFGPLMPKAGDYQYRYVSWYPYMVLLLAGAGMLLYLAGAALLFLVTPSLREGDGGEGGTPDELAADAVIDAQGEDAAMRGWRKRRAGWAVVCLLAASVCELAIAAGALALLLRVDPWKITVDNLQWYMWSYAAASVVTLALAALVWRRGGTTRARVVAALGVAPYTGFYLLFGLLMAGAGALEDVRWYSDMVMRLAGVAGLFYLAGAILILLAGGARHGRCSQAAENTGVAS
ncbi:hypothetical protein ABZU75_28375 [Streptosporangium sp. NPDC005286]|uniref:hypothetical protein n=1 Tax=Streptosporangium sp. NPDC005286 TaxID=3154463 RepID=UPI0033AF2164